MAGSKKLLMAAAGGAGSDPVYVEDVFSTFLYAGDSSAGLRTIDNGLNLLDEGGLIWTRERNNQAGHFLVDSERGLSGGYLQTNANDAQNTGRVSESIDSFTTTGYKLDGGGTVWNRDSFNAVSWSFRKQAGFFDIVNQTVGGTGTISHNLGSAPGMIIRKRVDDTQNWFVYHRSLSSGDLVYLDLTIAEDSSPGINTVTDSTFKHSGAAGEYVWYIFAHDDQQFGDDSDEAIIKCGSYTGNGNVVGPLIDLGFEPQFIMIKAFSRTGHWFMLDVARGIITGVGDSSPGSNQYILANTDGAEGVTTSINVNSTGFQPRTTDDSVNENTASYLYMAIRRPMKTPEAGTEVFNVNYNGSTGDSAIPAHRTTFPVDMFLWKDVTNAGNDQDWYVLDRLRGMTGSSALKTNAIAAESSDPYSSSWRGFDLQDGVIKNTSTYDYMYAWMFKRAPGFFDMTTITVPDYAANAYTHNLGVTPELYVVKRRNATSDWAVYVAAIGNTKYLKFQADGGEFTGGYFGNTSPSATQFYFSGAPNGTYITYLFATLAGVSKVGSYTGTGSDLNVDCGFSSGARFILIKRTDDSGGWYIYDSARGIVAGNDPYLLLHSTNAGVTNTDYIDPLNAGFTVTSSAPVALNADGGTYIFLAIA
tara:strand:- start:1229 stop:3166 length:1938 start_codon:yes stop_codon:yes gene_type:complete